MTYQKIVSGKFISRPNRFIAHVDINGEDVICHVKNTGRCKELLVPGCTVYLEDYEGRMGSRKLRYSLVAVEKKLQDTAPNETLIINMDSQAPNAVVKEALENGTLFIDKLGALTHIQPECRYEESRFDFYLEGIKGKGFLEVKGCTLESDGVASFPDAPTERGVKHIEELIKVRKSGMYAGILFVIQMEGMKYMHPNDITHPAFGDALRKAEKAGVDVMACECNVTPATLSITKPVEVKL